ncbi:2'-5' RNA ligase family protein [Pseudonocardia kongjuensis]|uniref:2'-5' RNA ligase family protein n=1 Tax=Pseudonocardia kongjuensis TaxID=102227 RepID=A0ABN1XRS2_9PSEU
MDDRPLILTALLDEPTRLHLDGLRTRHFPPERLLVGAHLTLFHALPAPTLSDVVADVTVATERAPMTARVSGIRSLGRGVAYTLDSPELLALRRSLAARWHEHLTGQDAGKSDLHVTVQNKVTPERARALHASLTAGFTPWDATVTGLALWRYDGGPWEAGPRFPFAGGPVPDAGGAG